MSQKKHAHIRIDNSLTDLVAATRVAATGGSSLSTYNTIEYSNNYALITLNRIILTYLYSGNGIFQTAIQLPIQDALSKGIEIESGEMSPEDIDEIMDWIEGKGLWQSLEDFWSWVRVYGGAALIINTDEDPELPLNMRRLKGKPIEFYDVDRWQLSVTNAHMKGFGEFEDITESDIFWLNGQPLHRSRCIIGKGKRAPSYIRRQLRGWGMSEAERMLRDLNNYLKTGDVLYEILDESKIDIYKIEGLAQKLLTVGGTAQISTRIQSANAIKSYVNALILDSKEEYEQKSLTFAGLADVMRENRTGVASALRMPMTKLFGLSASGFSTGEEDVDNYNQMVESEIRMKLRPAIRQIIELACANLYGYVPSFRFEFPSLKALKATDAETIKKSATDRVLSLFDRGLLNGEAAGEMLAKEEAIDAALAKKIIPNPTPPSGGPSSPDGGGLPAPEQVPVVKSNALGRIIRIFRNAAVNVKWDESKHPRDKSGKFGKGGGGESKKDKRETSEGKKIEEIKPQSDIPKPRITQVMGQKFIESMLMDISDYGPVDDDDQYKKEAFDNIKNKLEKNGITYVDGYHVTDMKSSKEGISGSSVDSTGSMSGNLRSSSVYMFFDPDDIHKGYQGIMGARNPENTVMHIKIPLDKLKDFRWDANYNITYDTYSAVRMLGDVPSKWIDGMYKYRDEPTNTNAIEIHRVPQ